MTLDDIEGELADIEIERDDLAMQLEADERKIAALKARNRNTTAAISVADAFIAAWSKKREMKMKGLL